MKGYHFLFTWIYDHSVHSHFNLKQFRELAYPDSLKLKGRSHLRSARLGLINSSLMGQYVRYVNKL